jgi:CheY-like chemotaxis protein
MTGNTSQQDQNVYFDAGFEATLSKPFSLDDVKQMMAAYKTTRVIPDALSL